MGDALFGAEAEGVIAYVESIIGASSSDTGWTDPMAIGAACPGTEVRFVSWADLALFFSNDSLAASGLRHFASYTYGPAFGPVIEPYGLTTDEGIGVGAEVSQLEATFPGGVLSVGDEIFGPSFLIEEGLFVFLIHIIDRHDIRMIEEGNGMSFLKEAFAHSIAHMRQQYLKGNFPA